MGRGHELGNRAVHGPTKWKGPTPSHLRAPGRQGTLQQAAPVVEAPELVAVLVHGRHRAKIGLHPALHRHLAMQHSVHGSWLLMQSVSGPENVFSSAASTARVQLLQRSRARGETCLMGAQWWIFRLCNAQRQALIGLR